MRKIFILFFLACLSVHGQNVINLEETDNVVIIPPYIVTSGANVVVIPSTVIVGSGNVTIVPPCVCPSVTPTPPAGDALELTWDDIANVPVADASSVSDWNTFFDLPTNGTPFTSVTVIGDTVKLYGGSGITLYESIFDDVAEAGTHLISIVDNALCVVAAEYDAFGNDSNSGCPNLVTVELNACASIGGYCFTSCVSLTSIELNSLIIGDEGCLFECSSLTTISLPLVVTLGSSSFAACTAITTLSIPSCTDLGGTTGSNNVFDNITGQTITVTCHASLLTCNAGAPDGDLCTLNSNNTITVNGSPLAGCP